MKHLTTTKTGNLFNLTGILNACGDYAGKYNDKAFDLIDILTYVRPGPESWGDIMFNAKGEVFAVWSDGDMTNQSTDCLYVQLDEKDCPEAFAEMRSKIEAE